MIWFIKDAANPVRKMQSCQVCKEETGQTILCILSQRDYCLPCWNDYTKATGGGMIFNPSDILVR